MSKKITNILVGNVGRKFNEWQTAIATLKEYQALYEETESELALSEKIMNTDGDGDGTNDYGMTGLISTTQKLHEKIDAAYDDAADGIDNDLTEYKVYREDFKKVYDAYDYHLYANGYDGDDASDIDTALTVEDGILPENVDGKHDKMILIVTNYSSQDGYAKEVVAQKTQNQSYKTYATKVANAEQTYIYNAEHIEDWDVAPYAEVYANLDVRIRKNLHDVYYYTNLLSDNMLKAQNLMYNIIQPEIDKAQAEVERTKQEFKDICPIYFENEADNAISDAIDEIARINRLVMQKYAELSKDANDIKRDFEVLLNTPDATEDATKDVKFTQFELDKKSIDVITGSQYTITYKFLNDNNVEVTPTNDKVYFHLLTEDEMKAKGLVSDDTTTSDSSDDSSSDTTATTTASKYLRKAMSVTDEGVVTGKEKGKWIISVKAAGLLDSITEIEVNVVDVKVGDTVIDANTSVEVAKGDATNFDITTDPESEITVSSIASQDTSIAIIQRQDDAYLIYGIAAGETTINVTLSTGDILSVKAVVKAVSATGVLLQGEDTETDEINLVVSESESLTIELTPENSTDEVSVTFDDDSIAEVSDTKDDTITVTGKSVGETTMTVEAESGVKKTVKVTVTDDSSSDTNA